MGRRGKNGKKRKKNRKKSKKKSGKNYKRTGGKNWKKLKKKLEKKHLGKNSKKLEITEKIVNIEIHLNSLHEKLLKNLENYDGKKELLPSLSR